MISVGSRDGRKRIGFGLDMEETELEEGEALNYHEENVDSSIDPDIALSYIGEKVQNVLGHFQKDFEGGVSAENLGAKYGGYGSFLPAYQRSPSLSNAKSPAEVCNYESPRTPRKLNTEHQRHSLVAASSASPSTKSHITSTKAILVGNSVKGNGYLQSRYSDESIIKSGINKKSVNEQSALKVRIRVGSENFPTQKNSDIYSGLGLVSPSSSIDDSPTTSEGQCGELLDVPEESPTSILQIMTSYTGELLLSPLSEDLIHLSEKRKLRGKCETKLVDKTSKKSGVLVNESLINSSSQNILEKKTLLSSEKDGFFVDSMYQKNNGDLGNNFTSLKTENKTDIDMLGCEDRVSNDLKHTLLPSSQNIIADPAKDRSTDSKISLSPQIKKEHLDTEVTRSIQRVEKLGYRFGSSVKASESKGNVGSIIAVCYQEETPKAEKIHALDQSDMNASKGIKALSTAEFSDPPKQVDVQKGGSNSEEGLESATEKSSSGGKRKQKGSQSSRVSESAHMAKEKLMVESSVTNKSEKSSATNGLVCKSGSLDLQKDHEKAADRYKELFGDVEFEDDDNISVSGEMVSSGKLRNPQLAGKRNTSKENNTSKEKYNSINSERPPPPENHLKPASHLRPSLENGQNSEALVGMVPLVKEDWVECDKCKKWRLLPLDANPKSLPDKWLCRMLNWLPGMNRCAVLEEETTNALRALYHPVGSVPAPVSGNQNIHPYNSVVTSVDGRQPSQENQDLAAPAATVSGKKKHGSGKAASLPDVDGSTHSLNPRKKSLGTPGKISKLSSRDTSPSVNAFKYDHVQKSSMAEKFNDAVTEKMPLSDKGTSIKMKGKRESDMEGSRSSKRMKSEELHFDDENWASDNGGVSSKAGRRSSSLSNNASGNDRYKYDNHKDLSGKYDDVDYRKRKAKEHHGTHIHTEPISNSGKNHLHSGEFTEELSESHKEKKPRLSKTEDKATSGTERKNRSLKDKRDGEYLNSTQAADYLKSDMGNLHPSVAANSSSSKVSDSHKNKMNGQESKSSPVESVSSSPLRFPNADKVTSTRKNLGGEGDFHDSDSLAAKPRRLSSSEVGGDSLTGSVKKAAVNGHVTDQSNQYATVEVKPNIDQPQYSGSHSKKSGKGSSSHSKGKAPASGYSDKVNFKASESRDDHMHLHDDKSRSRRNKSSENSGTPSKGEKYFSKKDTFAGTSTDGGKGPSQKKSVLDGQDATKILDKKYDLKEEHDKDKLLKKCNQAVVCGNGKSHSLPPLARLQSEAGASVPPLASQKENGVKNLVVDALDNGDGLKALNQGKKPEILNGVHLKHPTPNSHKGRDVEAPSPLRRESTSHAANTALKEAKDLKHMADRLKNSGSTESIGLYFQAALKFLSGASLLENGSSEATKHNELMHSMHIYSSTAKLCEFCAHEYEKAKDMAAASLAYKCVEVAYMRVVYSSHGSASRDRNELQTALQIVPPGESPSSSASDVDNLNHQATADKSASAKVIGSPHVSGNHIITSRNRSSLLRVLNYAQDANSAMEASRKSRAAFAAATSRLGESLHKDIIHSLKRALDYNFQDVEVLLRLVKIAMDAISR